MFKTHNLITLAVLAAMAVHAQSPAPDRVSSTTADDSAARDAKGRHRHGRLSNTPAAVASGSAVLSDSRRSAPPAQSASSSDRNQVRFPGDLSYSGGAVVTYAQSHAIYMNPVTAGFPNGACTIATCWGDPEGFLRDLGASEFIHVADQYVKLIANNRYTVGRAATINYVPNGGFSDTDILARVHAVAASTGQSGYGHIYHVFLPPGQDVCASPGVCYSPDIPSTDVLCGYHGSADFFDIGHVLYTVEPNQLGGCLVAPGSPNGALADSTNNSLSHEIFETITSPDGDAWFNTGAIALLNQEIGDECSFVIPGFFDVPVFKIGSKTYAVQREYDNAGHACATKPD